MDIGATAHIINDQSKFVHMYTFFASDTHFIELANGSRSNGKVSAKGKVSDNFSNLIWVYFQKNKFDACAATGCFFNRHFSIWFGKTVEMP